MCVYNHERYIAQALEGVVCQHTDFKYRVFVGDDFSTDGTRRIISFYAEKYPDKVFPVFHALNIGAHQNSKILYSKCKSKYVAMLDGDDCWTDPDKLQLQVNFLEANLNFVGCFHNTEERYEDDTDAASFLYCSYPKARKISFGDLTYSNVIPTCSVLFRNGYFSLVPQWITTLIMGDWPLHLLNAQFGDFWYIPKIMGVHRLHKKSSWMLQDPEANKKYTLEAYDVMIKEFSGKPELQKQLIVAKEYFIHPPKNHSSPSVARRGINLIKKIIR
jgi:glycosyltransferase involved in cell wall biosynthesis